MAGRKTKLTPEIQDRILRLVRAGNYLEVAAAASGVRKATLLEWLRRGEREAASDEDTVFARFSGEVLTAQAEAEARDVTLIAKAGTEEWQAAAWRLERKFPGRWGRRDRHDVSITDDPVREDTPASLQETEQRLLDRLAQVLTRGEGDGPSGGSSDP